MIKALSQRKYWEIAVAGLVTAVVAVLLVAFAGRWAASTWPAAWAGIHIGYVIVSAAMAWVVVGIFAEAAFYKRRAVLAREATDALMDEIAGYIAASTAALEDEVYDQEAERA